MVLALATSYMTFLNMGPTLNNTFWLILYQISNISDSLCICEISFHLYVWCLFENQKHLHYFERRKSILIAHQTLYFLLSFVRYGFDLRRRTFLPRFSKTSWDVLFGMLRDRGVLQILVPELMAYFEIYVLGHVCQSHFFHFGTF